jgi:hypothetical protein
MGGAVRAVTRATKKVTKKVGGVVGGRAGKIIAGAGASTHKRAQEVTHKPFRILTRAGTLTITAASLGAAQKQARVQEEKLLRGIRTKRIEKQVKAFSKDPVGKTMKGSIRLGGELALGVPKKVLTQTGEGRKFYAGGKPFQKTLGTSLSSIIGKAGTITDVATRYTRDPTGSMDKFKQQLVTRDQEINPQQAEKEREAFIQRTRGLTQAQLDELKRKGNVLGKNPNINLKAPKPEEFRIDAQPELANLSEVARVEKALSGRADFIKKKRQLRGRRATLLGRKAAIL